VNLKKSIGKEIIDGKVNLKKVYVRRLLMER
jgi:hypothetical protein